jgi:DNA-binding CsgD family transcriptional regulator
MIPPAHIICAFSQALYKLHSLLTPLDAVKAMLPSLAVLFRSSHISVDLLPLTGGMPRPIAVLSAGELLETSESNLQGLHFSSNVEFFKNGGFAPVLRISNRYRESLSRECMAYGDSGYAPRWTDLLGVTVKMENEALGITFHRDSYFCDEEAELAGFLQQHIAMRFQGGAPISPGCRSDAWEIPLASDLSPLFLPVEIELLFERYFLPKMWVPRHFPSPVQRWIHLAALKQNQPLSALPRMKIPARQGCLQLWFRQSTPRLPALLLLQEKKNRYEFSQLNKHGLTDRQIDIAFWLTQGKSDADIATLIGVAPRTVSKHVESVLAKLGCENRTAAAVHVIECLWE